jgi:hypothetical protein
MATQTIKIKILQDNLEVVIDMLLCRGEEDTIALIVHQGFKFVFDLW